MCKLQVQCHNHKVCLHVKSSSFGVPGWSIEFAKPLCAEPKYFMSEWWLFMAMSAQALDCLDLLLDFFSLHPFLHSRCRSLPILLWIWSPVWGQRIVEEKVFDDVQAVVGQLHQCRTESGYLARSWWSVSGHCDRLALVERGEIPPRFMHSISLHFGWQTSWSGCGVGRGGGPRQIFRILQTQLQVLMVLVTYVCSCCRYILEVTPNASSSKSWTTPPLPCCLKGGGFIFTKISSRADDRGLFFKVWVAVNTGLQRRAVEEVYFSVTGCVFRLLGGSFILALVLTIS